MSECQYPPNSDPYADKGKSFCVFPWISFYARSNNVVFPCCVYNSPVDTLGEGGLRKNWNLEGLREVRRKILAGQVIEQCQRGCLNAEKHGFDSHRKKMNRQFPNEFKAIESTQADGSSDFNMKYLDIRWTNLCNFKCRFCGFGLSSSWYDDISQIAKKVTYPKNHKGEKQLIDSSNKVMRNRVSLEDIKENVLPWVENVQMLGGEPLIDIENYKLLEHLIEIGKTNVALSITSNLSHISLKKHNFLELISHFKKVSFSASIDGIGAQAEYLRKGTVWNNIEENLITLIDFFAKFSDRKYFYIKVFHTVYALNAFHTVEAYKYLKERCGVEKIVLNHCMSPEEFTLEALPLSAKKELVDKYKSSELAFYDPLISQLSKSIADHGENESQLFLKLKKEVQSIDKVRGENFLQTFPEFSKFWNEENAKHNFSNSSYV